MIRSFALVAALLGGAPALAQSGFSDGYQFLQAVRKADGNKAEPLLKGASGPVIIDTKDPGSGEGALHIVTRRRDTLWLGYLLQKGAQPNIRDGGGNTPLMLATQIGWTDGMSLLLDRRAQADLANGLGETPLIRAVQLRNLDAVKLLLAAGANPKKADSGSGLSARDYAVRDPRAGAILRVLDEAAPRKKAAVGPN